MAKEQSDHLDLLGQPLTEGNYVAVSRRNQLEVCQVKKLNPKMIRVKSIKDTYYRADDGYLVYSGQTVLLSGPDALAYILTYAGS